MGLLKNAKEIETGVKEAGKTKPKRATIPMAGMALVAHLDAVIKACDAAKKIAATSLEEPIWDQFLKNRGGENGGPGVKPESFNAIEDVAVVNVQCRKRADNVPLKPEEIELINKVQAGIKDAEIKKDFKATEVILTPDLLAINPAYAEDTKLMDRVEKALEKVPGIPDDFIVIQKKKSKMIVNPEFEAAAWKFGDAEVIKIISCLGLRPSLAVLDPKKIAQTIAELFDINDEEEASVDEVMIAITEKRTKAMKPIADVEKETADKKAAKTTKTNKK
jgi:hypothetical protein